MPVNVDEHHCKFCVTDFYVYLEEKVTGDFILECPNGHGHYRHFERGVAVHCDISKTHDEPIRVKGQWVPTISSAEDFRKWRESTTSTTVTPPKVQSTSVDPARGVIRLPSARTALATKSSPSTGSGCADSRCWLNESRKS